MKVTLFLLAMSVLGIHFADRPVRVSEKKKVADTTIKVPIPLGKGAMDPADSIARSFNHFLSIIKDLDLVGKSGRELGIEQDLNYHDLCEAAKKQGYLPCPLEKALQLRQRFTDQPISWTVYIAVDPATANDDSGAPVSLIQLINRPGKPFGMEGIVPLATQTFSYRIKFIFLNK